jgi:hydroxyethylthiazole kinase
MATIAALVAFGIAGELAAATHPRPGGFQVRLLDALDEVGPEQIRSLARVVCAA